MLQIVKREYSYGNPHQVTDQGNRFKLNFEDTGSHPNACPGHYICYVPRPGGKQHGDVSLGNPDDFVDEGNRWVSSQICLVHLNLLWLRLRHDSV